MNSIKKAFLWYYLYSKRLVKKVSFVIILSLIPLFAILLSSVATEESYFYRVAVCSQSEDEISKKVIQSLVEQNSKVVIFREYVSEEESIQAVKSGKVDSAWVLKPDLKTGIKSFLENDEPLVKSYSKEENIFEKLAKEKLYNALYPHISYQLYSTRVNEKMVQGTQVDEQTLKNHYNQYFKTNSLVEFSFMDSNQQDLENTNLLTAPIRGMLCVLMLLCGMCACMYFSVDDQKGIYSNLDNRKKSFVMFLNVLSATSISAIAVTLSLIFIKAYTLFLQETILMILLVVMITLFCYLLYIFFNTPERMSVALPVVIILTIAFCPILINTVFAKWFSVIFPPYLYLYGVNNAKYIGYMLVYILVATVLSVLLTPFRQTFSKK